MAAPLSITTVIPWEKGTWGICVTQANGSAISHFVGTKQEAQDRADLLNTPIPDDVEGMLAWFQRAFGEKC